MKTLRHRVLSRTLRLPSIEQPAIGRLSAPFSLLARLGLVHLFVILMRFKVPGQDINVRLFERVETVDSQYDIFDVGIEQADGSIDSMVVGGSFSYAKSLVKAIDTKAEEAKAAKAAKASEPVAA